MKNRKTGKQDGQGADMAGQDGLEIGLPAGVDANASTGPDSGGGAVPKAGAGDSPAVRKLLEELTGTGEGDAFAAQKEAPAPVVSGDGSSGDGSGPDPLEEAEEELVESARSERSCERIRSIIAARRDAESRLAHYEAVVSRFRKMLHDTGMDIGDIAAVLHYGKLVASGDPDLMHCALDILNHERESLCRRLGIAEPGVDLFADVPEIRDALQRRELKMEHALRLANLERAERAEREKSREEAERGQRAVELFSDIADFMKTLGSSLQPYASQADHPLKMQRIFEYMLAPGWADEFVASVPRSMWARHVKYLYDNLALPSPRQAATASPLRSSPVVAGRIADNPGMSSAERIMRRIDEMGL